MTLTTRTGLRPCGKRYATEDEALRSKRGLTGDYLAGRCPYGCGGWHLTAKRDIEKEYEKTRKAAAQRDTGPDQKTRAAVLERDQFQCCACGRSVGLPGTWWSIQHRVARGQGGRNEMPNLVTLCGSATSPGCHRLAEDRDREMHERGYWLRSDEDPAQVPIMLASEFGSGITVWLTTEGSYSTEPPGRAA